MVKKPPFVGLVSGAVIMAPAFTLPMAVGVFIHFSFFIPRAMDGAVSIATHSSFEGRAKFKPRALKQRQSPLSLTV